MFCIDTADGEPVVAGLQTRCRGAAKPLSRGGFTEVGESEAGQLDVGAVTSADVSGVGAASPVDDADFPSPLTEGIPAYIDESGGEAIENEIFLVCFREIWAAFPDANLVQAYMRTPQDPTFANKRQRRIIMDRIIERVLRIEKYRTSRHEFASKVNELFAAYPEWDCNVKWGRIHVSAHKVKKRMGYTDMWQSHTSRRKRPPRNGTRCHGVPPQRNLQLDLLV